MLKVGRDDGRKPIVETKRRKNEHIEKLLKRFKRSVEDSGVIQELRERMYFVKPSARLKKKAIRSLARRAKEHRLALKKARQQSGPPQEEYGKYDMA